MSNIEQIRNILHSLLKKDYTFEIYNENAYYLTLSFNHLNSVYNGLVHINKSENRPRIDWQYHRYNKKVNEQLTRLSIAIYKVYKLKHPEIVENIIDNYRLYAKAVYNNKYALAVNLYTMEGVQL